MASHAQSWLRLIRGRRELPVKRLTTPLKSVAPEAAPLLRHQAHVG